MLKKIILAACILSSSITINSNLIASEKESREKDNTSINKQDRKEGEVTADQQGQSKSDLETTKKLREAIVGEESFSQYAHNIKIITRDGNVTLKGPVKSQKEKIEIEKKAIKLVGKKNMDSELEVVSPK